MNREFLKGLGLEDEAIDKIMAEHGKSINSTKQDLETVTTERDNLKTELKNRDTQLENLSKQVKDNEALTAEINRLKEENKTATQELQTKLEKQAFDFALESALRDAKAKNPKAVKALLDSESIKLVDGKLVGLDEQLKSLKESDDYLFVPDGLKGKTPPGGAPGGKPTITKEQFAQMGYKERVNLYNDNPELYKQLTE